MKTIAIIGGSGMLGSDLAKYLSPFFSITAINRENYLQFLDKSFDVLINVSGNSKRFWANQNVFEDFEASTAAIYKSIFDFKFSTFIYVSSSDVYKDHSNPQLTQESQLLNPSILTPYGLHKFLSEKIIEANCSNYLILRSSMILGTNLKKGPIYDILHDIPLFISKTSNLQMITTKEIASVIKFLLDKKIINEVFNIGGKGTINFKKINDYFSKPVIFSEEAEMQEYEMNVDKLNKLFPLKTSGEYLREFLDD